MTIIVRDVADDEIRRSCEIESRAYQNSDLSKILQLGSPSPEMFEKRIQAIIDMRKDDSAVIYKQVFNDDAGTMIGFAKWILLDTPEASAKFYRPVPNFGTGKNAEACTFFFTTLSDRQKHLMSGRPYLCKCRNIASSPRVAHSDIVLHYLHTDPDFQRRGAGAMLVKWGFEKADELGLPIYLESTTSAHQFYKNLGFKDIEMYKLDLGKFDGPVHEQPMMMREPVKSG